MKEKTTCPLCNKEFSIITIFHVKYHGFCSISSFLDYVKQRGLEVNLRSELSIYKSKMKRKKRPKHSEKMRGTNNPIYGRPRSLQTKQKISKNRIGKGLGSHYIRTDEIKQKISLGVSAAYLEGRLNVDRGHSGYYVSQKCFNFGNTRIFYRSSWEHLVMQYLDAHPNVVRWLYEPFRIKYINCYGFERYYIPDFYIVFDYANEVWEVKPAYKIEYDDQYYCKLDGLLNFINKRDIDNYRLISDDEINIIKNMDWIQIYEDYFGKSICKLNLLTAETFFK